MSKQDSREGQMNAVIDPKLLFMAKLAARYKSQTLVTFTEESFKVAVKSVPLWIEDCWDDDPAVRMFHVAVRDIRLLSPAQTRVFTHVCAELAKQSKKVTLKNFVEFFDAKDGE